MMKFPFQTSFGRVNWRISPRPNWTNLQPRAHSLQNCRSWYCTQAYNKPGCRMHTHTRQARSHNTRGRRFATDWNRPLRRALVALLTREFTDTIAAQRKIIQHTKTDILLSNLIECYKRITKIWTRIYVPTTNISTNSTEKRIFIQINSVVWLFWDWLQCGGLQKMLN